MEFNFKVIEKLSYFECEKMLKMVHDSFDIEEESIYFLKIFADFGKIFASFYKNDPICVIQTLKEWNVIDRVQIASFATHKDYQRKGVGVFTTQKMLEHLKSEGIKSVGIRIVPDYAPMIKIFKEKFGFVAQKMLPNYYGLREDRVYFEKKL